MQKFVLSFHTTEDRFRQWYLFIIVWLDIQQHFNKVNLYGCCHNLTWLDDNRITREELMNSSPAEPELKSATPSNMIAPRSAYILEWVIQKTCDPSPFLGHGSLCITYFDSVSFEWFKFNPRNCSKMTDCITIAPR